MIANLEALAPVEKTQILVVGGGPVGLFAALCAACRGLQVTVIEQNFRSYARGHATLLHPSSLRLLGEFGLAPALLEHGTPIERVELYFDGKHKETLELQTPALTIAQSVLEELLLKELRTEEVDVRSPCAATSIARGSELVQVRVVRRELSNLGAPEHEGEWEPVESSLIDAEFVIGADGYESRVRAALGLESLDVGATETFGIFEGPNPRPSSTVELGIDGGLGSAAFPLPAGRGRWGFQLDVDFSAEADIVRLRQLLAQRAPWIQPEPSEVEWSAVTHFERRLARRFGTGRAWLAGDAAHITSPFGGQSMNGGLSEAHDLVQTMAACIQERKPVAQLEQLGAIKEREWHKLLGFNVAYEAKPNVPSWLREHARRVVPMLPASGADLQHLLRQLGISVR